MISSSRTSMRRLPQVIVSLGVTPAIPRRGFLSWIEETRPRWAQTGLPSAFGGLIPVTIREAFPATGPESTRDRTGCSWAALADQRFTPIPGHLGNVGL